MLILDFLRHGETTFSRENAFCGCGTDASLTDIGVKMAEAYGRIAAARGYKAIFSSPLTRTKQTVEPSAKACGLQVQFRDGLKEISYGAWEGRTIAEVEKLHTQDHKLWSADPVSNAPTGGETATDVGQRALSVIDEIRSAVADGPVLIVSHKATIRIAICELIGMDLHLFRKAFDCPTASLSTIEFRKTGPMLTRLADRYHLDSSLRDLPGT